MVVALSLLMHLSPFINHTDASGLGSLKKGARGRKGTRHHLGKIPREQLLGKFQENNVTPVSVTTSLQLLHKTGFGGMSDTRKIR